MDLSNVALVAASWGFGGRGGTGRRVADPACPATGTVLVVVGLVAFQPTV